MNKTVGIGDVVRGRSASSPKMTVEHIPFNGRVARCVWFEGPVFHHGTFYISQIDKVKHA